MADRHVDHLLIGGGIAAASCAQELRAQGASGSVLLVGRELDPPYHRPPATKEYLQGRSSRDDALLELPGDVEVLTRVSVLGLDTEQRTATLSTKETVSFETALVATGAMVRRLQLDGMQLEGVHYLRALGNADALRRDVEDVEHVVCIGGSFIGCEVAASLTQLGRSATIVMLESEPLELAFGAQAGALVRGVLERHGVQVLGGVTVDRLAGEERVEAVLLADGRAIDCGAVIVGAGAVPDVMLARKAGLELGELGGVRCDERLQTSAPGIFAAGDVCEYASVIHGEVVRIEHEEAAAAQGRTAARNMLGAGQAHAEVPYFWTDLADWLSLEFVSGATRWDDEIVSGSPETGAFAIEYRAGGRLVACLSAGGFADLDAATREIAGRRA